MKFLVNKAKVARNKRLKELAEKLKEYEKKANETKEEAKKEEETGTNKEETPENQDKGAGETTQQDKESSNDQPTESLDEEHVEL